MSRGVWQCAGGADQRCDVRGFDERNIGSGARRAPRRSASVQGSGGDMGEVMSEKKKGVGFLGWLGRQVGYVKKAVSTDVTQQIVHREEKVEEAKLPADAN